jgi:signal peptidase II
VQNKTAKLLTMFDTLKKMTPVAVAIFFLVLDRMLKNSALKSMGGGSRRIVGDFFSFNFVPNENIAFSIPVFNQNFLIALNGLIVAFLIGALVRFARSGKNFEVLFFSLIISGAVSNLYDRVRFGFVVDYFDLKYFTVFNIADAMITVGAGGLIFFFGLKKGQANKKQA